MKTKLTPKRKTIRIKYKGIVLLTTWIQSDFQTTNPIKANIRIWEEKGIFKNRRKTTEKKMIHLTRGLSL